MNPLLEHPSLASLAMGGALLWGAVWGSFLNVVIYRLPRQLSLVRPGSRCPKCEGPIRFYDNVPVLSWLLLRGRCRDCKSPISARYPLVEALTGLLSLALFQQLVIAGDPSMPLVTLLAVYLVHFCFTAALVAITFIDLDLQIVPNNITYPGIVLGFVCALILPPVPWSESLLGILLGAGTLLLLIVGYAKLRGVQGMGLGDVKLLGMIGAFTGVRSLLFVLLSASLQGTLAAVVLTVLRKAGVKVGGFYDATDLNEEDDERSPMTPAEEDAPILSMAMPFGPFLALGAIEWILIGPAVTDWYLGLVLRLAGAGE